MIVPGLSGTFPSGKSVGRSVLYISSLTWADYVAYPLSRQPRPGFMASKEYCTHVFFVP